MNTKVCTGLCGKELPATTEFFHKNKKSKYGLKPRCKICTSKINQQNKEKIAQGKKKYYQENKDGKIRDYIKKNEDKMKAHRTTEQYKKRRNLRRQERYSNDPAYRLEVLCRNRINFLLNGKNKSKATLELIGCSGEELKEHLEKQFVDGMTWENYGDWHIDHIRPCASFDLSVPEQQRVCFHYTNLQTLWAEDNMRKGSKLDYCDHFPNQ
jgi:hypothetical protein